MAYRVPRCSRRFAARLFAVWRRALAALPRWARAQGLRGVVLAAACAPGGGWLTGGAANAAEYVNVYSVDAPSTATNGGYASLGAGDLLKVNADIATESANAIVVSGHNEVTVAIGKGSTVTGQRAIQLANNGTHQYCSRSCKTIKMP